MWFLGAAACLTAIVSFPLLSTWHSQRVLVTYVYCLALLAARAIRYSGSTYVIHIIWVMAMRGASALSLVT